MWTTQTTPSAPLAVNGLSAPAQAARQPFRVAAFGLGPRFMRMVDMIFQHDTSTAHRYQLADLRTAGEFDIALVNLTVPGGVDTARRLRSLPRALPVIGVGRRANRLRGADDLLFSSFARDVMTVLNRAADALVARAQCRTIMRAPMGLSPLEVPAGELDPDSLRVLVIDPSPSSRHQVAVGMRQLGIEVDGVGNLEQAADVLATRTYDLVIVDPEQPDGCGLTMLRRFRRATGSRVPVVVFSASSRLPDLLRSALAGCSGYLVKPLSVPALHATARRILLRNLYRRQRAAIGEIPMANTMKGKVLPFFPWRLVEAVRQRIQHAFRYLRSHGSDADCARRALEQARQHAELKAGSHGDGARVNSLLLSPNAVPIWRPGSTHCAVNVGQAMVSPLTIHRERRRGARAARSGAGMGARAPLPAGMPMMAKMAHGTPHGAGSLYRR
ncbi:MAG: response regulator [Lautropia sp.]|nr:response regulator [Lautropia sp.]